MRLLIAIFLFIFLVPEGQAQRYMTRTGYISFFSHTPLEDIKAENNQVVSALDISNGEIVFQVLIRSFRFEKALMEEHFNENYMDSEMFPRSVFQGKITDIGAVDFKKNGLYNVSVEGDLTIKDVTKKIKGEGTLEVTSEGIIAKSVFNVVPQEYNISIPSVVRDNIARNIEVTVSMIYGLIEEN